MERFSPQHLAKEKGKAVIPTGYVRLNKAILKSSTSKSWLVEFSYLDRKHTKWMPKSNLVQVEGQVYIVEWLYKTIIKAL